MLVTHTKIIEYKRIQNVLFNILLDIWSLGDCDSKIIFYTVWYLNKLISQVLILWNVISFYGTCNLTYININLIFPRKFEAIMFMSEQIPSKKFSMHPGFSNRPLKEYFLFHWCLITFWKTVCGQIF